MVTLVENFCQHIILYFLDLHCLGVLKLSHLFQRLAAPAVAAYIVGTLGAANDALEAMKRITLIATTIASYARSYVRIRLLTDIELKFVTISALIAFYLFSMHSQLLFL